MARFMGAPPPAGLPSRLALLKLRLPGVALPALGGRLASVGAATGQRAEGGGGTGEPPGTLPGCHVKLPYGCGGGGYSP